jgi:hypothetical protein
MVAGTRWFQKTAPRGLDHNFQQETGISPERNETRDIDRLPAGAGGSEWQLMVSLFLY